MACSPAMTLGSLSFAARDWLWPAMVIFLAGLFLIARSYPAGRLNGGTRWACFTLKAAGLALVLLFLLEPMWTTTRPREGANLFAVVADNSMGLQLRDRSEQQTRAERLRELLTGPQQAWQSRLEETFMVRRYLFDARLQSTKDFADLNFDGRETALGLALKSVGERFQGQPLAGVLIFTDGNATDLESISDVPNLPPVYPVVLGRDEPLRDLAVSKVSVSQTVFEDAPVTISGTAAASHFEGQTLVAELVQSNKVVATQLHELSRAQHELPLRFQVKPPGAGISFYEVRVSIQGSPTNLAEATLHNNTRVVPVDRGSGPHRILYVSGRPTWEYKFLNRAISEDPQVQLVGLIRIARREPKFTFRGRTGESSNPLFRGFKNVDEETERYDQPVLIRLNTKDELELRSGFPKLPEDLYGYKALIFDDLEADFFTPDQQLLVQRFVSERGGGFMMLGGADSLEDGRYARTPVGDMLPIYLDRLPQHQTVQELRLELTREGWLETWVRLRANEPDERSRLEGLPGFNVINQAKEIKPGASILATATSRQGAKFPAIVAQRFGNGRVAAITLGDLWRAGLATESTSVDLAKAWRQMARWLISDVPAQVELRVEPGSTGSESAVQLEVRAKDRKFEPLENANVQLTVTRPGAGADTNRIVLTPEAADAEPGVYRATFVPRDSGGYVVAATVADHTSLRVGETETGWSSEPLAREFASLTPNTALMRNLAQKTGGKLVDLADLEDFVSGLKHAKAPILETYSYPLWHKSSVFLLALACFSAEWGLRRWKGLA